MLVGRGPVNRVVIPADEVPTCVMRSSNVQITGGVALLERSNNLGRATVSESSEKQWALRVGSPEALLLRRLAFVGYPVPAAVDGQDVCFRYFNYRAARVVSDQIVRLGLTRAAKDRPHHPLRLVIVKIKPHTSKRKYTSRGQS